MIEIVFDLFITNEYGIETKVTDNIHTYKETREVGKIYNVCEFTLVDVDLPTRISNDGVFRIRVERKIDGVSFSDRYIIDDMKVSHKGQIIIVGMTKGALLFQPYMLPVTKMFNHPSYNELLTELLGGIPSTMYLPTIPNSTGFYEVTDETYGDVIESLCDKLGIDLFIHEEKIIFEEIKTIPANAVPEITLDQKSSVTSSTSIKDSSNIGIIEINIEGAEVVSETSMALVITQDPQPVRPSSSRTWIDPQTLDEYNIMPQSCRMMLFFNPLDLGTPNIQGASFVRQNGYYHVEEFDLVDESCVTLLGGISSLAGVTISDGSEKRPSTAQLYSGNDTLEVQGAYDGIVPMPLYSMNGAKISVADSFLNQPISSTITGAGTDEDPYDYTVFLGSEENVAGVKPTAIFNIKSMYSYNQINESLKLTGINENALLNGHTLIVDGTGNTATSGYNLSAGSTVFYLDPNKAYDSIAKYIFSIIQNNTFSYTAEIINIQSNIVVRPVVEIEQGGVFSGGVDEVYNAQRDNKAISEYVSLDSMAIGLYRMSGSSDTSNPSDLPPTVFLAGGSGFSGGVEDFSDWSFEQGHNVLCFNRKISATVRIAYNTTALIAEVPNSEYVKNIPIKATYIDTIIKHTHKIRAIDYFPLTYLHRLDVAEAWSTDLIRARYTNIIVYKVDNYTGHTTQADTIQSDSTGIVMLFLGKYGYGQYALSISGYPALFIRYYANMYDLSFDKIIIKPADSMGC